MLWLRRPDDDAASQGLNFSGKRSPGEQHVKKAWNSRKKFRFSGIWLLSAKMTQSGTVYADVYYRTLIICSRLLWSFQPAGALQLQPQRAPHFVF